MAINLAALAVKQQQVRTIEFSDSEEGFISHKGEGDPIFKTTIRYVGRERAQRITKDSVRRRVVNARKRLKDEPEDVQIATRALCVEAVTGWELTVAACRRLRAPLDYAKAKPDDRVDFNAENLAFMIEKSDFAILVLNCLNDFEDWHPEEAGQLGNSGAGPTGSTAGSTAVAAPASTPI